MDNDTSVQKASPTRKETLERLMTAKTKHIVYGEVVKHKAERHGLERID